MAAQDKVTFKQDLTEPVKIRHYEGVVFTGDDCGNLIKVALFDGGVPYSGGGTVSATAVLADGTTFPLTQGSITGNMVSVPLEAGALAVSGLMGLYVKISGDSIICTVLNAIFTVQVTDTGMVPAATVTTVAELVQEIKDAQDSFPADLTNLLAAVAPTFSTATAYSAGAYVWQGGKLYRFTAAHPAGTWTGTDAVAVALGDDVADLKSTLRERTDNLFPLEPLAAYGWTFHGNEVYGEINLLNGVKYLDDFAFAENTAYALSFYAKTAGETTDSNNGLRIRFYYTDGTYNGVSVRNNVLDYQYVAIVSDATKTVDYIQIYYSNQGGNTWYLRDVMLVEGAIPNIYSKYETSIDTTARNNVEAITLGVKSASPSAINQYVWDDMQTSAVSSGWVLDGLGTSMRDANGSIYKYEVTPGDLLWINADHYASGTFQFQNNASVGSTGGSNPYLIGEPVKGGFNDLIIVPDGATHLLVSAAVDNPGTIVKKKQFDGFENAVLPGYWANYIDDKSRIISRTAAPPVGSGTRFIFITDVHLRNADGTKRNAGYSPLLMRYLHEHSNIGLAFFGGDTLTGSYASLDAAVDDLMLFRDTFEPVWPWMNSVFGNHEYGNNSSNLPAMDKAIIYNALIRDKEAQYTAVNPTYGSYIYDIPGEKIRFICLNLNEGNNLTQQNSFFCNAMKDTPDEWTIIYITHFSLEKSGDNIQIAAKLTNTNSIIPAIEAYNARQVYGSFDFTNAGAEVACVIGGHCHWDGMVKTAGGIPVIATTCDMYTGIDGMIAGTTTEQAFDVFAIDTSAKTITTTRIGFGADRTFTYGS